MLSTSTAVRRNNLIAQIIGEAALEHRGFPIRETDLWATLGGTILGQRLARRAS